MSISAKCIVGPAGKPCGGGAEQGQNVTGVIDLTQEPGGNCNITYRIEGLTPGLHGFHM